MPAGTWALVGDSFRLPAIAPVRDISNKFACSLN